ncbi:MAG: exodeoxyribonuclease V subunit alpha [Zoogloeaceae bacterium]|jgi:exodeoxyribonuclease V alpha subunit|nr:exodeoxyribonuclease V subunit alpha [Zoogloeaceae bacterium]
MFAYPAHSGSLLNVFARAFADQCYRWSEKAGKDAARQAGYRLILAEQEGETSIELTEPERQALLLSGLLAKADEDGVSSGKPLMLDSSGRLYLARYLQSENRLAAFLAARNRPLPPASHDRAQTLLQQLFSDDADERQQQAVALALKRQLVILSGGPGTGKTRTMARLLACLLASTPTLRVALAAPTGKAASRMQESLIQAAQALPPEIAALLPAKTFTIHRLLGMSADGLVPRYHAGHPLPFDLFIVDEASMLDLSLAEQLFSAIPPAARLILIGDAAQLPAVEAGNVFAALTETKALREAVIRLEKNYRFSADTPLGGLIGALASGNDEAALAALSVPGDDLIWLEETKATLSPQALDALAEGFAAYKNALAAWQPGTSPAPLFDALNEFRILAALRENERGTLALNAHLNRLFAPRHSAGTLFPGQAIMVTRNDPDTRLYNGDTGILLPATPDSPHLKACFPDPEGDWRYLDIHRLPEFETAFALTVHKAQGSEFTRVALVLPGQDTPLLTRELVYTALTRAKKQVLLIGEPQLFATALKRARQRKNSLTERIQQFHDKNLVILP